MCVPAGLESSDEDEQDAGGAPVTNGHKLPDLDADSARGDSDDAAGEHTEELASQPRLEQAQFFLS